MRSGFERLLYLAHTDKVYEQYRAKFKSLGQGRIYTIKQKELALAIVNVLGVRATARAITLVENGEAAGAESIWQALQELGATRLGHAVTAIQDPYLIEFLAEQRIGIETNLTSNVQTNTVQGYADHPARVMLERGLLVTLNTDDPGISAIDLPYEYEVAAPAAGLTLEQIRHAQRNALEIAFLTTSEKEALLASKARSVAP